MKRSLQLFLLSVLGALLLPVPRLAAQDAVDYVVIVHKSNPVQTIDKGRLSKIFLKKIKRWDESNETITPYDLYEKSEVRESFTRAVHGKSISAIKSFWQRMIFSARDVPPDELDSEEEMIAKVAATPGAVGYVGTKIKLPDTVKALTVTD